MLVESVPFQTSSPTTPNPSNSAPTTSRDTTDDLIGRIAQSAHDTIDRLAEGTAPYVNRLHDGVAGGGNSLQAGADRAREMTDEWAESLRCTVRENPLAAIGVALAFGLLIARLAR